MPAVPHMCAASSVLSLSRRASDACVNVEENFAQMFSLISMEMCPTVGIYIHLKHLRPCKQVTSAYQLPKSVRFAK